MQLFGIKIVSAKHYSELMQHLKSLVTAAHEDNAERKDLQIKLKNALRELDEMSSKAAEHELRIRNINENLAELSTCVSDLMELEEARRKNKFGPKQRMEHRQTVDAKLRSLASNVDRLLQGVR